MSSLGKSESEAGNEDLQVAAESLEKDEELKMHLLGANSYYTQPLPHNLV